jgi:tetratricopeptide (TPR) repeat protein
VALVAAGIGGPFELAQSYNLNVAGEMLLSRRKTMKNRGNETSEAGRRLTATQNELRGLRWRCRAAKGRRLVCAFYLACIVLITAAAMSLPIAAKAAQDGSAQQADRGRIQGVVRDAAGHVVDEASVHLEHVGVPGAVVTKTNAEGGFAFAAVGAGTFQISAEKSGRQSGTKTVVVVAFGGSKQVDLMFDDPVTAKGNSASSAPVMEFTDKPNFTVAAVTDWTAAGGHGSDANLRTSEALTRETLTLKSGGAASKAPGSAGEIKGSESALRQALVGAPGSFKANHELGGFYLRERNYRESVPLLRIAYQIDAKNYDNEYALALALKGAGEFSEALEHVHRLMARGETADLHRLAGEVDEKSGDPLAAVHEFEQAVREDPSEQNYFEWGSELLLHRAVWQAKDVFSAAARLYPKSARLLTALGAALFAGALYDEAAQRLCEASDLNPADPEPYMFMGKIEMAAPHPLVCVEQKLARFVEEQPGDPLANYFYAMTVWKQHGQSIDAQTLGNVQGMLTRAVTLDPRCSDAYLQLGVLESSQRHYEKAVEYLNRAIESSPQLSEAHYRLGVAYDRIGEKEKARREFQLHDEIEKQQAADVERQRREVKQFLVVVDGIPAEPLTKNR